MEAGIEVDLNNEDKPCEDTDTSDSEYFEDKGDNLEMGISEEEIGAEFDKKGLCEEKKAKKGENVYFETFEEEFSSLRDIKEKPCETDDTRSHTCSVCSKSFVRRSHLKSHVMTRTGLKPFKCEICGKDFSRKGNVTKHHKIMHSGGRIESPSIPGIPKKRYRDPNKIKPSNVIFVTKVLLVGTVCGTI